MMYFCKGKEGKGKSDFLQMKWCSAPNFDTSMTFIKHPGVGYNGDLDDPVYSGQRGIAENYKWPTGKILDNIKYIVGNMTHDTREPDLVVVDSSLWDLSVWAEKDGQVSDARVLRWCHHDLPGLLAKVSDVFPSSRVAFRTAPNCIHCPKPPDKLFSNREIDGLYKCITSSTRGGKLFDKYEVVDFHAIMSNLSVDMDPTALYQEDGYHPSGHPSMLYMMEIIRLLGETPHAVDAHPPHHHHPHHHPHPHPTHPTTPAREPDDDPDDLIWTL